MQICPVNREWVHNYLLEPYLQGCELVNCAWTGIDRSLSPNLLKLEERVICWLQGVCLLIPWVNIIVWLAWQTFGSPEKLFDRYCPELESPSQENNVVDGTQPAVPIHPILLPLNGNRGENTESLIYTEKVGASTSEIFWNIEHFKEFTIAQQHTSVYSSTSVYRPDRTLRHYHYNMDSKECDIWQEEEDRHRVHLKFTDEKTKTKIEQTFEIPEGLPLIQQRVFGLRPFVQSNKSELYFYVLIPELPSYIRWFTKSPPFLMKTHAKKIGEEDIPGHGRLLKIELMSAEGFPYNAVKSEMWFDIATGKLIKFLDTGMFIHQKEGEIQNNQ